MPLPPQYFTEKTLAPISVMSTLSRIILWQLSGGTFVQYVAISLKTKAIFLTSTQHMSSSCHVTWKHGYHVGCPITSSHIYYICTYNPSSSFVGLCLYQLLSVTLGLACSALVSKCPSWFLTVHCIYSGFRTAEFLIVVMFSSHTEGVCSRPPSSLSLWWASPGSLGCLQWERRGRSLPTSLSLPMHFR